MTNEDPRQRGGPGQTYPQHQAHCDNSKVSMGAVDCGMGREFFWHFDKLMLRSLKYIYLNQHVGL